MSGLPVPTTRNGWRNAFFLIGIAFGVYYLILFAQLEEVYYQNSGEPRFFSFDDKQIPISIKAYTPQYLSSFSTRELRLQISNTHQYTSNLELNPDVWQVVMVVSADILSEKGLQELEPRNRPVIMFCAAETQTSTSCMEGSNQIEIDSLSPGATATRIVWVTAHNLDKASNVTVNFWVKVMLRKKTAPQGGQPQSSNQAQNGVKSIINDGSWLIYTPSPDQPLQAVENKWRVFLQTLVKAVLLPPWSNGLLIAMVLLVVSLTEPAEELRKNASQVKWFWLKLFFIQIASFVGILILLTYFVIFHLSWSVDVTYRSIEWIIVGSVFCVVAYSFERELLSSLQDKHSSDKDHTEISVATNTEKAVSFLATERLEKDFSNLVVTLTEIIGKEKQETDALRFYSLAMLPRAVGPLLSEQEWKALLNKSDDQTLIRSFLLKGLAQQNKLVEFLRIYTLIEQPDQDDQEQLILAVKQASLGDIRACAESRLIAPLILLTQENNDIIIDSEGGSLLEVLVKTGKEEIYRALFSTRWPKDLLEQFLKMIVAYKSAPESLAMADFHSFLKNCDSQVGRLLKSSERDAFLDLCCRVSRHNPFFADWYMFECLSLLPTKEQKIFCENLQNVVDSLSTHKDSLRSDSPERLIVFLRHWEEKTVEPSTDWPKEFIKRLQKCVEKVSEVDAIETSGNIRP